MWLETWNKGTSGAKSMKMNTHIQIKNNREFLTAKSDIKCIKMGNESYPECILAVSERKGIG